MIFGTENSVVIQSGEAMLALWGALKSCLRPADRVLAISTGVFGCGIGEMAASMGAEVRTIHWDNNETIGDQDRIDTIIKTFKPKMITAVHCETPSGTLNPLTELGKLKNDRHVPILYVMQSPASEEHLFRQIGTTSIYAWEVHKNACQLPPAPAFCLSAIQPGKSSNRLIILATMH